MPRRAAVSFLLWVPLALAGVASPAWFPGTGESAAAASPSGSGQDAAPAPPWARPLRLVSPEGPFPRRGLLSIGVGEDAAAHVAGRVDLEGGGKILWGHPYDLEKEDGDAWNLERQRFYMRPARDPDVLVLGIEGAVGAKFVLRMDGVERRFALDEIQGDGIVTAIGRVRPVWIQFRPVTRAAVPWSLGPAGERAWRTSLHTHSCFSDSRATLGQSIDSLLPWVRQVWWTDHDLSGSRAVSDGGFEVDPDPREVDRGAIAMDGVLLWPEERARRLRRAREQERGQERGEKGGSSGKPPRPGDSAWPWEEALATGNAWRDPRGSARVRSAGVVSGGAFEGDRCYELAAESPGEGAPAEGGAAGEAVEVSVRNGRALLCALAASPRLRFAVRLDEAFPHDAAAFVDLDLSSQARFRWRIHPAGTATADAAPHLEPGPRGHPLLVEDRKAPRGEWTRFEVDPVALHDALLPGEQDGLLWLHLGLTLPAGARATARFDAFTLEHAQGAAMFHAQREALDGHPAMRSFLGEELTEYRSPDGRLRGVAGPHLTLLFPGDDVPVRSIDAPLSDDARRARVAEVHAAGGAAGMHHVENQVFWEAIHEQRGWGADLLEITHAWLYPARYGEDERELRDAHGYPARVQDEHYPYLVRWDRLTGEGIWLTGYAAPDLHELYSRPSRGFLNRGLTWIHAEGDDGRAMLQALRAGRCSFGDWRFDPWLDVETARGFRMGEVVWTDHAEARVRLVSRGLPAGCHAVAIAGGRRLVEAAIGPDGATEWIDVPAREAGFVRFEVEHEIGFLLAATNFIAFVREPPRDWGAGRAAMDTGGVRVRAREGAWLDAVRPDDSSPANPPGGSLVLEGRLERPGGFVELLFPEGEAAASLEVSPRDAVRVETVPGGVRVIPRALGPFRWNAHIGRAEDTGRAGRIGGTGTKR